MVEKKFAVLAQPGQGTAQWDIFAPNNQDSGTSGNNQTPDPLTPTKHGANHCY